MNSLCIAAAALATALLPAIAGAQSAFPPAQSRTDTVEQAIEAARTAARADRNRESADLFAKAIREAPQRRRELLQEYADQLIYSGRAALAVPLYQEALTAPLSQDEHLRLLKGLGLALLWTDRPGEARPVFAALLREQPADQDARRSLGRALSWGGRQREAITHLRMLLRDHPDDHEARVQLAQAQAWMGRPDEAAATLDALPAQRDDARKLREELDTARAPRTIADVQRSSQSDELDIRVLRLGHSSSFASGRGTIGFRVDRIDYEREDGADAARVTRPVVHGRYRLGDGLELNAELGRERVAPRGSASIEQTVYSSWLTWWPSDLLRVDLSANRYSFDNLHSLRLGLTARQQGLSADFTPNERQRYTARIERANYSDGNVRRWAQVEGEYRWRANPDVWVGLRHTRFEFDRELDNGYFNPLTFQSTQATLRTTWRPDGAAGRWDLSAQAALGREDADPGGSKPAYDLSLRAGWRLDPRTRIEARAQRFSSRTTASGFARSSFGVALERSW